MSFFQIPISAVNFQPQERTIPRQFSSPSTIPVNQRYYQSNDYPFQYLRNQQSVERNVPFKVYVFEGKFNHNLNSVSNVLRFEIDSNNERSFELFDRILREHSIDMRQYELHYVDEEDDLVALTNYRDFKFMLKLMNGKLTKIICEKKSVQIKPPQCVSFNRIIPQQQQEQPKPQCFFSQFQQTRETQKKHQEIAQHSFENMIEQAFRSAFTNESDQPRQQPQPATSSTPAKATPQQTPRVRRIEISLADLLGIPKRSEEESKKEESKQEVKKVSSSPLSFKDLILQRMNEMKEEEEKNEESIQEKKEVEKPIETPTIEPTVKQVSEPEIVSTTSPNMTTSLLLSNLIEESTVPEQTESDNKSVQSLSNQELENQDPIIESIPEEEHVEEQTVKTTIPHKYQKELKLLNDMGFSNHILNVNLLNKYEGNIQKTISDLIQH